MAMRLLDELKRQSPGLVGFPDGTTRGGHIISATVWPTLELFLTDEPSSVVKEEEPDTGLVLFHPESLAILTIDVIEKND